ncbi:MAG TPA: hypothetical protein VND93_12970 [Myxococcales bacterium]|nr:hypothetical protein [Myxococcales bacterium]
MTARWLAVCLALAPGLAGAAGDGGSAGAGGSGAARWLRPYVKALGRSIEVYHYAYRPAIGLPAEGPLPADPAFAGRYLERKGGGFWNLGYATRPFMVVGGLYAAIDPVISRTSGGIGERWVLFQLTLPAGFRFLDVRGWSDNDGKVQRFPPAVRAELSRAGCDVEFPSQLLILQETPACRALGVEAMKAVDADGLMYRYQGYAFDGCQGRPVGAFIIVRPERVEKVQVLISQSPGPDAATEAHLRVRRMYEEARGLGSTYPVPWPDLAALPAPEHMAEWKRERLFGCGGHPEDRMPGPP